MTHLSINFNGHFAYLKTLDFYFKKMERTLSVRSREVLRAEKRLKFRFFVILTLLSFISLIYFILPNVLLTTVIQR